jgi:hypothetical protein
MLPVLAVTDPKDATLLFDLVNRELAHGENDTETRARLCDILIALHREMTRTENTDTADTHCAPCDYGTCAEHGTFTR